MTDSPFPSQEEIDSLLVGPESVAWQFGSDARLHFVALYPLLLQVAHPTVGAGVRDYSDFERRPWDQLLRTLDYVTLLIYGGQEAIAWVHATLIEAYITGHAHFGRRMRRDQVERFYSEYRGLGRLIGVRESALPPDYDGFRECSERTTAELVHTQSVDRVLSSIRHAAPPPLPLPMPDRLWRMARLPAARVMWLGGLGPMSPPLRARRGVHWQRSDELAFRGLGRLTRGLDPVMPDRLKLMGPAQLRWRAAAIARGPLGADALGVAA